MDYWRWGIDALLGEQTRPHKDLDLIMHVDNVVPLCVLLGRQGYMLKELWEENQWVTDRVGHRVPTAFVLYDAAGCELDLHVLRLDEKGNEVPAWEVEEGVVLRGRDLAVEGKVVGQTVRCLSPDVQMQWHTGYVLPEEQVQDLKRLHQRFKVAYPMEHAHLGE